MKRLHQIISLLLVMATGGFAQANDPAEPQPLFVRLKGVAVGTNADARGSDLQVVGDLAYSTRGGLQIFSLSNSTAPMWLGGYDTQLNVNAVHVVGPYAYLAEGAAHTLTNVTGAFEIIDVRDPAHPIRVGGLDTRGRANAIRVVGNFAYVAQSTRWTGSNLLGALEIFDVLTATNPIRAATFDTAGSVTSVDVSGGYAYLTDGVTDLQVIDVRDPSQPWRAGIYQPDLSRCAFEPFGSAKDVRVVGNLAYSSGDNGLNVLDISNPSQPVRVLDNSCIPIYGLRLAGHHAFMVTFYSSLNTFYLTISDTTNPTNWMTVGAKVNWPPVPMHVVGNLIYVATDPLSVYEISDRPAITSVSIDAESGSLFLTWDLAPGFVLQRTTSLGGLLWTDVPGSADGDGIELPLAGGPAFFRLARP